jgi:hypothetical protein
MGLDISAHRKVTKIDCVFDEDDSPIDPQTREYMDYAARAYANPDFPGREQGVEDRAYYNAEESESVLHMSYGRYNRWRDQLAKVAGYALGSYTQYVNTYESYAASAWAVSEGPFWELINFSDCEGTIGPVVSAKLSNDFAQFDEQAKAEGEDFYRAYQELRRGFEMAADGGMVSFH